VRGPLRGTECRAPRAWCGPPRLAGPIQSARPRGHCGRAVKSLTGAAIEPHPRAVLAGDDGEAVMLDLVQPLAAGGPFIGFGWKTRRDEPGRQGMLQHAG